MNRIVKSITFALPLVLIGDLAMAQTPSLSYQLTWLGSLGGDGSIPFAINNRGEVVGSSRTASGEVHAFVWKAGKMTDLGTLGGMNSFAFAINDLGHVLGGSQRKANGQENLPVILRNSVWESTSYPSAYLPVLWKDGTIQRLAIPPDAHFMPGALNNKDEVAGLLATKVEVGGRRSDKLNVVLWRNGTTVDYGELPAIKGSTIYGLNDNGVIVGQGRSSRGQRAFLGVNGFVLFPDLEEDPRDFLNATSAALSVNNAGQVIGRAQQGTQGVGFIFDKNRVTFLPKVGITDKASITSKGDILFAGQRDGFLWRGGQRYALVDFSVQGIASKELSSCAVIGMNDAGVIIGLRNTATDPKGFILTPIASSTKQGSIVSGAKAP